jgi:hypothetical protein
MPRQRKQAKNCIYVLCIDWEVINTFMRFSEFAPNHATMTYVVQPDQVKRLRLRNTIAANIAKDSARAKPTADDLALAFARYCQVQRQANRNYEKSRQVAKNSSIQDRPNPIGNAKKIY